MRWAALIIAVIAILYVGKVAWQKFRPAATSSAPFVTQTVNDLTVNFVSRADGLRKGDNNVVIEFRDRNDQLLDVGDVDFKIDMADDWNAKISFDGSRGQGQKSFMV